MRDFTRAKCFTNGSAALVLASAVLMVAAQTAEAQWSVDFSRRSRAVREADLVSPARADGGRRPASIGASEDGGSSPSNWSDAASVNKGVFDTLFEGGEPIQEIVIMNTERGFVPTTVRVRKNGRYKIHVVNVNDKEKNVSFILDGFSEHHATYYGKVKTFNLEPRKEGTFSFQSPETSAEGKLVVFNPQITIRNPASE
jgi:hypothetical protein